MNFVIDVAFFSHKAGAIITNITTFYMSLSKISVKQPVGNAIQAAVTKRVFEAQDMSVADAYRDRICAELDITGKGYTQLLNNNSELTVKQLAVIAQVLEVPMADLLTY